MMKKIKIALLFLGSLSSELISRSAMVPSQVLAAYLFIYYQLPKWWTRKKYLVFFGSLLLSIFVLSALGRTILIYVAEPFFRDDFQQESIGEILSDWQYLFIVYFPAVYIPTFILWAAKAVKESYEVKHELEVLQKEKVTTELKFLKAQIHPHFLFNTLNNLYALTLDQSPKAPEVVIKLSEMLDYILYQCSDPTIAIHKEVALIQNYIDLELLRYGENIDLQFNQQIDDAEAPFAPLILLSIIENAFKHGASKNPINPMIHIDLKVEKQQLSFEVYNSKSQLNHLKDSDVMTSVKLKKGVGSTNIKRQLDLIYPENYNLAVEEEEVFYKVTLNINLQSLV